MKSLYDMDTIQIEITNVCTRRCANCTRFVKYADPFFLSFEKFKEAIDSMFGYPKMTGIMGGEPLLHPEFERLCDYAASRIPRDQLGLWTSLPQGYGHYRETICRTFGNVFINDHTRADIYHHPFLVAAEDMIRDRNMMFVEINKCYFQESWSASINPYGAFFCEMAASFSMLYRMPHGWKVEPGWWWRTPKDYREQIERFCRMCGGALKLKRRVSTEEVDDMSDYHFKRLQKKIKDRRVKICNELLAEGEMAPLASYKDQLYRNAIAGRYGIFLTLNEARFNEPHLLDRIHDPGSLLTTYREKYGV